MNSIFPSGRPNISVRVLPKIPATMVGAGGIGISKENGVWTIEPAWDDLALIAPGILLDPTTKEVWVHDPVTDVYNRMTLGGLGQALFWGTSTSSVAIGAGSRTFTTQSGKDWLPGMFVQAFKTSGITNFVIGQVTAYSGVTLTVNVLAIGGSGTHTDWTIVQSTLPGGGPPGATGQSAGIDYNFVASTSGDPGTGNLGFNNVSIPAITGLRINNTDRNGVNLASEIATWDDSTTTGARAKIRIAGLDDPAKYVIATISGAMVENVTFRSFPLINPVGTSLPSVGNCQVEVYRTGDMGVQGPPGIPGGFVTVSDTPPLAPSHGMEWFESDTGKMFVYYDDGSSAQWIHTNGAAPETGGGGEIANFITLTPEQFGAVGDGVADDTAAFVALAAYVNASAKNGCTILFGQGKDYKIWPTLTTFQVLMQFNGGVRNLVIDFNGSRIFTPAVMTNRTILFYFNGISSANEDIQIDGLWFEQTGFDNLAAGAGVGTDVISVQNDFRGLIVNNMRVKGALEGLTVTRTDPGKRARGFSLINPQMEQVFYPIALQKNGDSGEVVGGYFKNTCRSCILYNVHGWKIDYVEDYVSNISGSVVISVSALSTESEWLNTTSNIDIKARYVALQNAATGASPFAVNLQAENPSPGRGIIRNIKLHVDAELTGMGSAGDVIAFNKVFTGGVENTIRGHTIDNFVISGNINFNGAFGQAFRLIDASWYGSGTASSITFQSNAFTGSITGDVLTVTAVSSGAIYPGTVISGVTVTNGIRIISQLTGTAGSTGTYKVSVSGAHASQAITGTYGLLTFGGTIAGGTPNVGAVISGTGVIPGTRITAQVGGSWVVSRSEAVASTTIYAAENICNIVLRDFTAIGAIREQGFKSIVANLTALPGPLVLDNVTVNMPCNITGVTSSNLKVKSYRYLGNEADTIVEAGNEPKREVLTASRTYYVRTDGSNSNNGLANTAGGAFLTIQKAIDAVAAIDLSGYAVNIQVGAGTYSAANNLKSYVGAGPVNIIGNTTTPSSVIVKPTSAACFSALGVLGKYNIQGFQLQTITSGSCILAQQGSVIEYGNIEFMEIGSGGFHVTAAQGAIISGVGPCAIKGGAYAHFFIEANSVLYYNNFITPITGTMAFSPFCLATLGSIIYCAGCTFPGGTVTGSRYTVQSNAVVQTGGGASYFPGNAAGAVDASGVYQ